MEKIFPPIESRNEAREKQLFWNDTMAKLNEARDGLGKLIDRGIIETVTALNVNGFPTRSSCEGHIEKRFGKLVKLNPYVDIGNEIPNYRFIGEEELKSKIAEKYKIKPEEIEDNDLADKEFWDYIHLHDIPETMEFMKTRGANEELANKATTLMEEFYSSRHIEKGNHLLIDSFFSTAGFRITFSLETLPGMDNFELARKQKEISDFGMFLKDKYFQADAVS